MSFVGGLLGGSSGAGFQAVAPSSTQLTTANNQVGNSIQQQQAFVNALQGQNGLANQSNVFGQQQALAGQLQGVANGTGPNPAMAALNQATGANVANQASLMAGQRGSGANAGLIARQAAQQGAATQQQAVGQGATMQAQQSLAAMQALQGQQANMANMANTQVNQQQAGLTGLNQNTLQQQSNLYGLQSNANSTNAGIAQQNAQGQGNILGGVMGGIGSAMNLFGGGAGAANNIGTSGPTLSFKAEGGEVKEPMNMADGGPSFDSMMQSIQSIPQVQTLDNPTGPQSAVGKMFNDAGPSGGAKSSSSSPLANATSGLISAAIMAAANGGRIATAEGDKVPALVSPGEIRISKKDVKKIAEGKKSPLSGEKIPGKPKVGGAKNSYANDTIPKTLNEGDIILPRSVTQSKHPHWAAHKFVSAIMAQKHRKK